MQDRDEDLNWIDNIGKGHITANYGKPGYGKFLYLFLGRISSF